MKTFYVTVDLYITAKDAEAAEEKAVKRLERIAERRQINPYEITAVGDCEDV